MDRIEIDKNLQEIREDFALFDDWEERYRYLIDLGRALPPMDDEQKTEETLVRGCTSRVWMVTSVGEGELHFIADSDAHIVRGLIGLLARVYQGALVDALPDIDIKGLFSDIGLDEHLSPNRRSGFFAMVDRLQRVGN